MRTFLILVALLALPAVFAVSIGCCCDPVTLTGSLDTDVACSAKGFTFLLPPSPMPAGFDCTDYCNSSLGVPVAGYCGDGICQASESAASCPQDCGTAAVGVCSDPLYDLAPVVDAVPVKGEKAINLSYDVVCPASRVLIDRCAGPQCSSFSNIADLPYPSYFVDYGTAARPLLWDQDFSYRVRVEYDLQGLSEPAVVIANPGDIECAGRGDEEFCVSEFTYLPFEDYLAEHGYGTASSAFFSSSSFQSDVASYFGNKFNSAFVCDDENVLSSPVLQCDVDEVCVGRPAGAECLSETVCGAFDPFGLFGSVSLCEGMFSSNYCFFDRSSTVVDECYSCSPAMVCYDYKSEGSCSRDNCGVGNCEWSGIDDTGLGVCVDSEEDNCEYCSAESFSSPTLNVSSPLESCSDAKAEALSTSQSVCFYDRVHKTASGCDLAYCGLYSSTQCSAPANGIVLDDDNGLVSSSTDPCGIGVCDLLQVSTATGVLRVCFKDADGDGLRDCPPGDVACERDYFPPETSLFPSGPANRVDQIDILLYDKRSAAGSVSARAGSPGYTTHLCVVTPQDDCSDPSEFPVEVSAGRLYVKNTALEVGSTKVADLLNGSNVLRYYSRDPANNVGVVKEFPFNSCQDCQGPYLINLSVDVGTFFEGSLYTSSLTPEFTFFFDERSAVVLAELVDGSSVPLSAQTSGLRDSHIFTSSSLGRGDYTLRLNAHNDKNIYMSEIEEVPLVVDTTTPSVSISPGDGESVSGTVDLRLNFSAPVILRDVSVVYDSFDDPYAAITESLNVSFSTSDNRLFTATLSNPDGGAYSVVVAAVGLNGKPLSRVGTFFVESDPNIRLTSPGFGVTALSDFDVEVLTPVPAECSYLYDVPDAPAASEFPYLAAMSGSGRNYSASGFSIDEDRDHPLHVLCDFGDLGVVVRTFDLRLDTEAASIVRSFAEPSVIAESYFPNESVYRTNLKVELDKPGFCKYSPSTSTFSRMKGTFPGFGTLPKISHIVNVSVDDVDDFEYYVVCKGLNGLKTSPETISFTVDPSLDLAIKSSTPGGFGATNASLGIVANKRVLCYYGDDPDELTDRFGRDVLDFSQRQSVNVDGSGKFTYYVRCVSGISERSGVLNITFFVDTSPPSMLYVNDSSTHPDAPQVSWMSERIRVSFLAEDDETGVDHYVVSLRERDSPVFVFREAVFNVTDGEPFYISSDPEGGSLGLEDGMEYLFQVYAVNPVGLESDVMDSSGVTIDTARVPPVCSNGLLDPGETDVDCGGKCDSCSVGKSCVMDDDCSSNFCNASVCAPTSCADGFVNGWETDVDCGGESCSGCENGLACIAGSDCLSGFCDPAGKRCRDAPACQDGFMSEGESDIDCGGACTPCGAGKSCFTNDDCAAGLSCSSEGVCSSPAMEVPRPRPTEEVEKTSFFLVTLKWLVVLLLIALVAYGAVYLWKRFQKASPVERASPAVSERRSKQYELDRLREFAKEEMVDSDWVPLDRLAKKAPLSKEDFEQELQKLRKLARQRESDPIKRLRSIVRGLPAEAREELSSRFRLLHDGVLSDAERRDLLKRLRITSEYYEKHKGELEKELRSYGK